MTPSEVENLFSRIRIGKGNGVRAPHKPLLLLYALAKCSRRDKREIPFLEVEPILRDLLREFGPRRSSNHPEYPFSRLRADDLWEFMKPYQLESRKSNTDPKISELKKNNVEAGFTEDVYQCLQENPSLLIAVTWKLLEDSFPSSVHQDILQAVGFEPPPFFKGQEEVIRRRKRDPNFRRKVREAYDCRCSICDFQAFINRGLVGVEAAHIKWHQFEGPDIEENGLALCALHHKMFDRGCFTIDIDLKIYFSPYLTGNQVLERQTSYFNGREIFRPKDTRFSPKDEYLNWHTREVFQGEL